MATGKDVPRTSLRDVAVGPIRSKRIETSEFTKSNMAEKTPKTLLRETPGGTTVSGKLEASELKRFDTARKFASNVLKRHDRTFKSRR